jgi:hypothetical protein
MNFNYTRTNWNDNGEYVHDKNADGAAECGATSKRLTRNVSEVTCPACIEAGKQAAWEAAHGL